MGNFGGVIIGKALYNIIKDNAALNTSGYLNNKSELIQPFPMRGEKLPILGVTYEVDSVNSVDIKRDADDAIPINISTARLTVFAQDYKKGVEFSKVLIEIMGKISATHEGLVIDRIFIDSVREDFNEKTRRYTWGIFLNIRIYN